MRFLATTLMLLIASLTAPGTPVGASGGLSVTLWAGSPVVSMGAAIDFHVSLAFDTAAADSNSRMLNRYSESCEFAFVNNRTGESFRRVPFREGMPAMPMPGDLVRLTHDAHFVLDALKVHLLSDKGDQIPPGTYSVRVTYVNDGGEKKEAYVDSTHEYHLRTYRGQGEIWTGRIVSAPFVLTVLSASPARVDFVVPAALAIDTTTIKGVPTPEGKTIPRPTQIAWWCNPDSKRVIHVVKRPGFMLGNRWHLESRVDGKTIGEFPRGSGGLLEGSGKWFLDPDVSSQLLLAEDSELVLHMEVFETSEQHQHLWSPERGDFKVLWTGQIRYGIRGGKH